MKVVVMTGILRDEQIQLAPSQVIITSSISTRTFSQWC